MNFDGNIFPMKKISELFHFIINNPDTAIFFTPPIYKSAKTIIFSRTQEKITLKTKQDFDCVFEVNNPFTQDISGFYFLNYEAGYLFEERQNQYFDDDDILGKLFLCDNKDSLVLNSDNIEYDFSTEFYNSIEQIDYDCDKQEYIDAIKQIKEAIKQGYTYQVNFTIRLKFQIPNLFEFISQLVFNQSAEYITLINDNDNYILSISPELFFKADENRIIVEPMKGTINRGKNLPDDAKNISSLLASKKDSAENLMIVDLLRNDIGKICNTGSVKVVKEKYVKTYETLHQMVTRIEGTLKTNNFADNLLAIYPSGSITGAPKIKTMEIIKKLENTKRGIYTGAIGYFHGKEIVSNIPIRTFKIDYQLNTVYGTGSGIVWDSDPDEEYKEVMLKADFFMRTNTYFELFETMLAENNTIFLIEYHIIRLKNSARYFLFCFNENTVRELLQKTISNLDFSNNKTYRLKLQLNKWGKIKITSNPFILEAKQYKVCISDKNVNSQNRLVYHKTTNRKFYNKSLSEAKQSGFDEILFFNEHGNLTEGSYTNIIIKFNGKYITPPVGDGLLNGCMREYMIEKNIITEDSVTLNKILKSDECYLINSVRKILPVDILYTDEKNKTEFDNSDINHLL